MNYENLLKLQANVQASLNRVSPEKPWSLGLLARSPGVISEAAHTEYSDTVKAILEGYDRQSDPVVEKGAQAFMPRATAGDAPVPAADPKLFRALTDATGRPRFVEGQLITWYDAFVKLGGEARDSRRKTRLQALAEGYECRIKAEQAAAADPWIAALIRPLVDEGDQERRKAQDQLFANESPSFAQANELYDRALKIVRPCQGAFEVIERVAAELPYYGEWQASRLEKPDEEYETLLDALGRLSEQVDNRPRTKSEKEVAAWAAVLKSRAEVVQGKLDDLASKCKDEARKAGDPLRQTGWRDVDALLRVPMLDPDDRRRLLVRAGSSALSPPLADAPPPSRRSSKRPDRLRVAGADPGEARAGALAARRF